jgi:hypothetical protein
VEFHSCLFLSSNNNTIVNKKTQRIIFKLFDKVILMFTQKNPFKRNISFLFLCFVYLLLTNVIQNCKNGCTDISTFVSFNLQKYFGKLKKVFSDKVQDYTGSKLSDNASLIMIISTVFSNFVNSNVYFKLST